MRRYWKSRNQRIYTLLIILCVVGFWLFENFYTPNTYKSDGALSGTHSIPDSFIPQSDGERVNHDYFVLSYNEYHEQAEWLAYKLRKADLTYDERERPYFIEDPLVSTKSADFRNYRGSGFDRGHLCPAGDRRFSEDAYDQTFYTSNISPQDPDFNAGIWNRLEQQIRRWCHRYGDLYVITSGVLEPGLFSIGEEDVSIPDYFYKIVIRGEPDNPVVLAFLMPSEDSNQGLREFAVSVDRLEELTGIDFFHQFPSEKEKILEATVKLGGWKF